MTPLSRLALIIVLILAPLTALADEPMQPVERLRGGFDVPRGRLHVAALLPLSGKLKRLGHATRDGLAWGLHTLQLPVELEVYDTAGDPQRAIELITALQRRPEISAIIGPLSRDASADVAPHTGDLPVLSLSSVEGIEQPDAGVFRLRLAPEDQSRGVAQLAFRHLDATHAAVMFPDDDYGRACALAFIERFEQLGGAIVAAEPYRPGATRLEKVIARVRGRRKRTAHPVTDADMPRPRRGGRDFSVLFIPDDARQLVRVGPFLQTTGMLDFPDPIQLLGTSAWGTPDLALDPGLLQGALVPTPFDPARSDVIAAASAFFQEQHERPPSALEAQAHDALLLLEVAFKQCGDVRACIRQRLRAGVAVDGLTGRVALSPAGAIMQELLIFEVDANGQLWPTY